MGTAHITSNDELIPLERTLTTAVPAEAVDGSVALGTSYFVQRYLYAFATQHEVNQFVRTQAIPSEAARLAEILGGWESVQSRVRELTSREAGLADTIEIANIPETFERTLRGFADDPLFARTFSGAPTGFAMVEIDKLIAPQRTVNSSYVERIAKKLSGSTSLESLVPTCLSPTREMDPVQHLEVAPNVHVFSSPNSDIRFLGGFLKEVSPADRACAISGGIPVAAVIAFVGYGAASINVIKAGHRIVLNNGFHRVYAMRSLGVTHIPVVVQIVNNPALEFPPHVAGLPKDYLLGVARPVLMKDFFEPEFAINLKVRNRIKTVTVNIGSGMHDVPA